MTVNTKEASRRALRFSSIEDLAADLDNIEAAAKANTLTVTGNWTAGQILEHCNILFKGAIDGFPGQAPLFVRVIVKLFFKKKALSGEPLKPGIKLGKGTEWLLPNSDVGVDQGIAMLRASVDRVLNGGERFTHASPAFGELTHEEWVILNLGHCSMHMSFIEPGPEERRGPGDRRGAGARRAEDSADGSCDSADV